MAKKLTVEEASTTYLSAMRNVQPAGRGICRVCHTFIAPGFDTCRVCFRHANHLDAVVPITYSEDRQQMHHALRAYKEGPPSAAQRFAHVRLTAILWRFIERHEPCVARAAGVTSFDRVTVVPSSTPAADDARPNLRKMVRWTQPLAGRFERLLRPTGAVPDRDRDERRYTPTQRIDGVKVLLIDDTWVSGSHAQSAAHALRTAGTTHIACVVIGRHLHPGWEVEPGRTTHACFSSLPERFDWSSCAVH